MTRYPVALVAAKGLLGASIALGCLTMPHAHAAAPSCTNSNAYAREVGDDNCDGIVLEDESGWDCATMGNFVCGAEVER